MLSSGPPKILQFIPARRPAVMARMLNGLSAPHALGVLDLEDGHWQVGRPQATAAARQEAREGLLSLASLLAERADRPQLALRVNPVQSPDFGRDLPVVERLWQAGVLQWVLLPKLNHPQQLQQALEALRPLGVRTAALVPMLESVEALQQASCLVEAAAGIGSHAVAYGHYDYCLDAGLWPFPASDQQAYWQPAERVMAAAEAAGLAYVHPVPSELAGDTSLRNLVARLRQRCGESWSIFSAGPAQTEALLAFVADPRPLPPPPHLQPSQPLSRIEQIQLAEELCRLYEARPRQGLVCASDPQRQRFVSPHVYAAALRRLQHSADA